MGWSCAVGAGKTMDSWTAACIVSTGSSNVYVDRGRKFFWEVSRREHPDGAITGTVYVVTAEPTPEELARNPYCAGHSRKAGTFRIEPDGSVSRAPAWLKRAK